MRLPEIRIGRIIIKRCQTCRHCKPGRDNMAFCILTRQYVIPTGCDRYEKGLGVCKLNRSDSDNMIPNIEDQRRAGL